MVESVLEFKILDELFCFNAKNIAYVFELEDFKEAKGFHSSVVGITKYNKDIMLLVDTANLYSESKKLDLSSEKSVVVVHDESGMKYGMIVDEILKIETLTKEKSSVDFNTEDMVVNYYKDSEKIINEIHPLPLLIKYNIPAMANIIEKKNHNFSKKSVEESKKSFFLFKIAESLYGIESQYIQEVVQNTLESFTFDGSNTANGAILLRDEIIQLVEIGIASEKQEDIIILKEGASQVAFAVDEVYDIELFDESKIEYMSEQSGVVVGFCNYNSELVGLINPLLLLQNTQSHQDKIPSTKSSAFSTQEEYLIFLMNDKRYTISMASVRQVVETSSLSKTESSAIVTSEHVKFITTWNHNGVNVVDLSKFLDLECNKEESESIFLEESGRHVAFMVQEIDNIVYLESENISDVKSEQNSLIDGAILYDDEIIVRLNTSFIVGLG